MNQIAIENFKIDKSNWKKVKLGDVVFEPKESVKDPIKEGILNVVGLEHIDSEDIHLRRSASIDESTTFTKRFRKGDVLFGRRRAYLKKAAIASFDGICSGDITVMRAKDDLLTEILPFVINNDRFFDYAVTHSAGGLSPRVKFKDLANYEFVLPQKEHQTSLLELLLALHALAESQNDLATKIEKFLALEKILNIDCKVSQKSSDLILGWKKLKIKEFSKVQAGATPLRSNNEFFIGGQIPWVKTLDLNNEFIFDTQEKITELGLKKSSCNVKKINTVLVAMYGGFNQIGRTGLLKIPATTNQAISAIEVDDNIVRAEYLLHVLNAKIDYWKKVAISTRKDPNITKSDVENFPVNVPPLAFQDDFLRSMNLIHDAKKHAFKNKSDFKQVYKNIINMIF